MFSWHNYPEKEETADFYFQVELTEDTFKTLEKLLQGERVTQRGLDRLKTCVLFARQFRKVDLPLVGLPWSKLAERVKKAHSSEAEAIFDWRRQ